MALRSSASQRRLGQLPDPLELVRDHGPDPLTTGLDQVDLVGQGPEDDEVVGITRPARSRRPARSGKRSASISGCDPALATRRQASDVSSRAKSQDAHDPDIARRPVPQRGGGAANYRRIRRSKAFPYLLLLADA